MTVEQAVRERVLRPSPLKTLLFVLFWLLLAAVELVSNRGPDGTWSGMAMWTSIAVIQASQLLPTAAYLKIGASGFEVRSFFRRWSCRWADVGPFELARPFGLRAIVTFRLEPGSLLEVKSPARSRWMTAREGALPDSYGMPAESLARLLNDYRARMRVA